MDDKVLHLYHLPLQAESRLAAKRAARAEAREIRMKEIERQQKEVGVSTGVLVLLHEWKKIGGGGGGMHKHGFL